MRGKTSIFSDLWRKMEIFVQYQCIEKVWECSKTQQSAVVNDFLDL